MKIGTKQIGMDDTKKNKLETNAINGHVIKEGQGESKLDSRKFFITLAGLILVALIIAIGALQGLVTKDNLSGILTAITGIVGGYVIGQGYADGQAAKKPDEKKT